MGSMIPWMRKSWVLAAAGFFVFVATFASEAAGQITPPSANPGDKPRQIARFFIDGSKAGSGYETGPLHIVYDDGTESLMKLPPLEKGTDKEVVFNDVGFSDVKLAADKRTMGWTVDTENCCTSYPLPAELVVFRHGHILQRFGQIRMIWSWMFVRGGERVAIVSGFSHGPEVGDYRLYDVKTGKLLAEVWGDENLQALKPGAPSWAKLLEEQLHSR